MTCRIYSCKIETYQLLDYFLFSYKSHCWLLSFLFCLCMCFLTGSHLIYVILHEIHLSEILGHSYIDYLTYYLPYLIEIVG